MREMFVRSDTAMAVLSALPAPPVGSEFANQEGLIAMEAARQLGCDTRVLLHGGAYPHVGDLDAALLGMTAAREDHPIVAWKIYTMVPSAGAFYFDDHDPALAQIGQRFIDHVREIGPPIICTHRGISSIVGSTKELASPSDIGPAAARNPDISFVVYHSGYEPGDPEGPYDPGNPAPTGIDRLIRSVLDAGLEPNQNVYAELGGTWWFSMRDPDTAAHVLGKLLRYIGEDRVVWGTDSIWFGTPQDQIQALRTFEISEELQERHGYPALTDEIKAKIFGLTSAALYGVEPEGACRLDLDDIQLARAELPPPRTYGPETIAEAAMHIRAHQGVPFV
jgi:predicted TIM-barrel fold metal-dependent hydrolase